MTHDTRRLAPHPSRGLAAMTPVFALAAQHGHHMRGPSSLSETLIFVVAALIVVFVLVLAIKLLIWPGERSRHHIKRSILDDSVTPPHEHQQR